MGTGNPTSRKGGETWSIPADVVGKTGWLPRTAAAKSRLPCGHLIAALKALRRPKALANAGHPEQTEDPYTHLTAEGLRGAPTPATWPPQNPHTKKCQYRNSGEKNP